uniref:GRIP domain-containing protein n=1 Tax=Mesocestoides corti TaxID=53468 RepID=A0A5K3F1B3_MESCO
MSTVSEDECYSNVDSIDQLRQICRERDVVINKLKLLVIHKNKTIAALEEDVRTLKSKVSALQTTDKELEEHASCDCLRAESIDGCAGLRDELLRLQTELDRSKKEVETLSKMNGDLQKVLTSTKQEREMIKSEVSTLTADLLVLNTERTELYEIAANASEYSNTEDLYKQSHHHHTFIVATLKNLVDIVKRNQPNPEVLCVLQGMKTEVNRLRGLGDPVFDNLDVASSEDLYPLLKTCLAALRQCPSSQKSQRSLILRKDRVRSYFIGMMHICDESKAIIKVFTEAFLCNIQSILSMIDKLNSYLQYRGRTSDKLDLIQKSFSELRLELGHLKETISTERAKFSDDAATMMGSIASSITTASLFDCSAAQVSLSKDAANPKNVKLKDAFSIFPSLQNDAMEMKTSVRQWFESLQIHIRKLQKLQVKLVVAINKNPELSSPHLLPHYSECTNPCDTSSLESLFTDVWQIKDSLSGARHFLVEESSQIMRHVTDIQRLRYAVVRRLYNQVGRLRGQAVDIHKDLSQLVIFVNKRFSDLSNLTRHNLEESGPSLKSPATEMLVRTTTENPQRQRFEDYDRLVRDKDTEINQLRESCDRLSDECDRLSALRDALRQLSLGVNSAPFNLREEDNELFSSVACQLTQSRIAHLELVEQAKAISDLQSELMSKNALLEEAVSRALEAEERVVGMARLEEELSQVKQLLLSSRRDAVEVDKLSERVINLETEQERLIKELAESARLRESAEAMFAAARREADARLEEISTERDSLSIKLNSLQQQFDAYKVKALHALRNGKDNQTVDNTADIPEQAQGDTVSWRYECSNLVQTEASRLKETVRELEQSLSEMERRLQTVTIESETTKFALAEQKNECLRLSQSLLTAHAQWREERELLAAQSKNEVATRISELEASLAEEKRQHAEQLAAQAEDFKSAFGAKIADLLLQLEKAEAKPVAQHLELSEQTRSSHSPQPSVAAQEQLCSRCNSHLNSWISGHPASSCGTADLSRPATTMDHRKPQPLEQILFGEEETASVDSPDSERSALLQATIGNLRSQLASEHRSLEHTRSLLADSEATVERLTAQANVKPTRVKQKFPVLFN